jgi:hypothetical protein
VDFSLLLKIGFILLPAGASIVIASRTVRQGGNVSFPEVLRNSLILFGVGTLIIVIAFLTRFGLESSDIGFELEFGAGEVLIMLGVVELLRYLVFGKRGGTQTLAKTGWWISVIGALLIVAWVILYLCGLK